MKKRNIFISFLGTTSYKETHYRIDGVDSPMVRFIQEALLDRFCKEWSDEDRIYIFYTKGSKEKNWENSGHFPGEIGLKEILGSKPYASLVRDIRIDEGFSTQEVWSIFEKVYEVIEENDQIYLDVTHAFRSIPMFSTVLFHFSQFTKNTDVIRIDYGAFEALGDFQKFNSLTDEEKIAPVVNLNGIILLQHFVHLISDIVADGRIGDMDKTLKMIENRDQTMKQLVSKIKTFDYALVSNRTHRIEKGEWKKGFDSCLKSIKKSIKKIQQDTSAVLPLPAPFLEILDKLDFAFQDFVPYPSKKNIEAAIAWTQKYDMIPQMCTLQLEYIITLCCEKLEVLNPFTDNSDDTERQFREFVSAIVGLDKRITETEYRDELAKNIEVTRKILSLDWIQAIKPCYAILSEYRNIINHGKLEKQNEMSAKDAHQTIKKILIEQYQNCLSTLINVDKLN